MNNSKIIRFIGDTLLLDEYPEFGVNVKENLSNADFSLEHLVSVSSEMLVLPAMYLSLQNHGFTGGMPAELCEYLEFLCDHNRERNKQILSQLLEIQETLASLDHQPVYLKGVAYLISGLYKDSAARVISDIDIFIDEKDVNAAIDLLGQVGYSASVEDGLQLCEQEGVFPKLIHESKPAAIDIHCFLSYPLKKRGIEYDGFDKRKVDSKGVSFLIPTIKELIRLNIYNVQIHDKAWYYGDLHLRQYYDLYLLLHQREAENNDLCSAYSGVISRFHFMIYSHFFGHDLPVCMSRKSWLFKVWFFYFTFLSQRSGKLVKLIKQLLFLNFRLWHSLKLIINSLFSRSMRRYLHRKISGDKWLKNHLRSYHRIRSF